MNDQSPYAGLWVAIIDEQIVGVGHTAEEALQSTRHHPAKERAALDFIEQEEGESLPLTPLMDQLRELLRPYKPVYLVGGAVRDALLGRASYDLDFVVAEEAIKLSFYIGNKLGAPAYMLDEERDTGRVVLLEQKSTLDFARFRDSSLIADLRARDFTINALAIPATSKTRSAVIDPTGGLQDLEARRIRMIEDRALVNDPVRTLRAVRLAASLNFTITKETRDAILVAGLGLGDVTAERKRDEILKILMTSQPDDAMRELDELGLLRMVLPEVAGLSGIEQSPPHYEDVISHTWSVLKWLVCLEAVFYGDFEKQSLPAAAYRVLAPYQERLKQYLSRPVDGGLDGRLVLRMAAVFHDVGKRQTYEIDENGRIRFLGHAEIGAEIVESSLKWLCLSKDTIKQVKRIVAGHMRPLLLAQAQGASLSRRAVYRYFRALDHNGLDVALLSMADHLATYNGPGDQGQWTALTTLVGQLLMFYFEQHGEAVKPVPLLNGRDLMDYFGIEQGPEIGRILRLVEEGQAAGDIRSREEALQLVQEQIL